MGEDAVDNVYARNLVPLPRDQPRAVGQVVGLIRLDLYFPSV